MTRIGGDRELARAHKLARVLDDYMLDPVLGFVLPGAGDVIGSLLGLYIVGVAVKRRVSPVIIARMLMNLGADTLLGVIPLLGDVFDFTFKANRRNIELLAARSSTGGRARARDWLVVAGAVAAFVALIALIVWGIVALFRAL